MSERRYSVQDRVRRLAFPVEATDGRGCACRFRHRVFIACAFDNVDRADISSRNPDLTAAWVDT